MKSACDSKQPFWLQKNLDEMTSQEWESLCDGCGRCCLNKLVDEDDNILTVAVACKLLDLDSGLCRNYKHRRKHVPDCIKFTPKTLHEHLKWLPDSCAYRLLYDGYSLPDWHPLITGNPESVHDAGFSVRGKGFVSEDDVPVTQWHDYIICTG